MFFGVGIITYKGEKPTFLIKGLEELSNIMLRITKRDMRKTAARLVSMTAFQPFGEKSMASCANSSPCSKGLKNMSKIPK